MSANHVDADCALLREWLSLAGVEKPVIRELAASRLADLVNESFDARAIDEYATQQARELQWLHAMCANDLWRPVLYELCLAHPQCALLQAAVRSLSQGEHAAEVQANPNLCAAIGGTSSLQTFLGALDLQLNAMKQGQPGAQATLDGLAAAGEPEFLCSQALLQSAPLIGAGVSGLFLEQACARMGDAAASTRGQASRRLQLLGAGVPRQSAMLNALVSILTAGTISSGDAQKLQKECEGGASTAPLMQPTVLRLLLYSLFDPSRPPKPGTREQLLGVLALVEVDAASASAVAAEAATGASASAAAPPAPSSTAAVAAARERALADLKEAQGICERNEVSEVTASVAALQRCAHGVAAASGVLVWCRVNLTTPQYSGARFNATYLPNVLRLIAFISVQHAALRDEACSLLFACLTHEPPSESEMNALTTVALRRQLLDGMLLLLAHGSVFPVLALVEQWLPGADLSLVRHLLQQLLHLVVPPFSDAFARRLLAMIRHPRTLEAHRSSEMRAPLIHLAGLVGARMPALAGEATEALAVLRVGIQ